MDTIQILRECLWDVAKEQVSCCRSWVTFLHNFENQMNRVSAERFICTMKKSQSTHSLQFFALFSRFWYLLSDIIIFRIRGPQEDSTSFVEKKEGTGNQARHGCSWFGCYFIWSRAASHPRSWPSPLRLRAPAVIYLPAPEKRASEGLMCGPAATALHTGLNWRVGSI